MGGVVKKATQSIKVMYVTKHNAAIYCGYNPDYFLKLMKKYDLPKYGPKYNRYKLVDLDEWMKDPSKYEIQSSPYAPRQRKKVY